MSYEPSFKLTGKASVLMLDIAHQLSNIVNGRSFRVTPRLRRINRVKSIHSSLAIEQNSLALSQVRDIVEGKPVLGPQNEIQEIKNALEVYSKIDDLDPYNVDDLLSAHAMMVRGLGVNDGFRKRGEGVFDENGNCIHMAPPAELVPGQIADLLGWLKSSDYPLLVKSCVFHYEFEFIHPFEDGNGRMGRFWHTLLLSKWDPIFKWVPVETAIRANQNEYYHAISVSNEAGDSTVFLEFMLGAIQKALCMFRDDAVSSEAAGTELTSSEAEVYALIREGDFQSIAKASLLLNLSTSTVSRALASLKERGLITRSGANRNGRWLTVRK